MRCALLGAALTFAVGLRAPTRPVWPSEFNATLTIADSQQTQFCYLAYSASQNGTYCDYSDSDPFGLVLIDIDDYAAGTGYTVSQDGDGLTCIQWPESGGLRDVTPQLHDYAYNGTATRDGVPVLVWVHAAFVYLSAALGGAPVAWTDRGANVTRAYTKVTHVGAGAWPRGLFRAPTYVNCT